MIKTRESYFVISHGASLKRPLLVNTKTAKWLLSQGVKVVDLSTYLEMKRKWQNVRASDF